MKKPADLLRHRLLHIETRDDWRLWFAAQGIEMDWRRGPLLVDTAVGVQAAVAGKGVILVRRSLIGEELAADRIVIAPVEQVVPNLVGADRRVALRGAQLVGVVVADADVSCLALGPQLLERSHRLRERRIRGARHGFAWGLDDQRLAPFWEKLDELKLTITNALERKRLYEENQALRRQLRQERGSGTFVGKSPAMLEILDTIRKTADSGSTVMITGESGTGKELVARALHRIGARARGPFVAVNCAALVDQLLESELFGHVRGSFTGAVRDRRGLPWLEGIAADIRYAVRALRHSPGFTPAFRTNEYSHLSMTQIYLA